MMRKFKSAVRRSIGWALLLAALQGQPAVAGGAERPAPNVILIFIDDMGYGDVGFNGATGPRTPNLDRMAFEGMRFNDFYVGCAVCSGSRTALMTGSHYQRLSMNAVLFPNSTAGLHPDEVTIADMLLEAGYATKCVGKWHLGHLPPCLPTYQGFESYYGIPYSNDMWIDPANKLADDIVLREGITREQLQAGHKLKNRVPLMRDDEVVEYPVDQTTVTRRYTEEALRFIRENKDQRFFLYLPHTMVHLPLAVSKEFENRTGKLIWDAIEEVDWSVGQILQALQDNGIDERTLVIFTSDNGAAVGSSLPLRAKKGSVYDGGIREPTVMRWPGHIPAGKVCHEVAATIDILPTLAGLCGGQLPERQIDGHDIWPLMSGQPDATSPHGAYCLLHGPGAVRSGKWKYYPWPEGGSKNKQDRPQGPLDTNLPSVQLYDTVNDIGETSNVASGHPEVVARLQAAWETHVAELEANRRPTADLIRPRGALSPSRPGSLSPGKPIDWAKAKVGQVFSTRSAPNVVRKPFSITCAVAGDDLEGVILAHGGTQTGYSLYVLDEQLVFAIRTSGDRLSRVKTSLPAGDEFRIKVTVNMAEVSVVINGDPRRTWQPLTSTALLEKHPSEDLSIGWDNRMPVDPLSPTTRFNGVLTELQVDLVGE